MKAEDLIFNGGWYRQALKDFSKTFPDEIGSIFFKALIIESIQFVDFSVLVVPPQDSYSVLVLEFQQDDIEEGLHAIEAAVNVISHEQVIGILKLSRKYG